VVHPIGLHLEIRPPIFSFRDSNKSLTRFEWAWELETFSGLVGPNHFGRRALGSVGLRRWFRGKSVVSSHARLPTRGELLPLALSDALSCPAAPARLPQTIGRRGLSARLESTEARFGSWWLRNSACTRSNWASALAAGVLSILGPTPRREPITDRQLRQEYGNPAHAFMLRFWPAPQSLLPSHNSRP